jgi:hypothetical protein
MTQRRALVNHEESWECTTSYLRGYTEEEMSTFIPYSQLHGLLIYCGIMDFVPSGSRPVNEKSPTRRALLSKYFNRSSSKKARTAHTVYCILQGLFL